MKIEYALAKKTDGANPFKIFEELLTMDSDALSFGIRQMSYPEFLKTAYWFAVSMVVKSRAGRRCQVCNSPNNISVHHRTYDTHGKEHLYTVDLVVLCGNCHGLFHGHINNDFVPDRAQDYKPKFSKPKTPIVVPHDEIVMPEGDPIILTKLLIDQCRANGSFTNATLNAFSLTREEMKQGWTSRLIGKSLSRAAFKEALGGRFIYRERRQYAH